MTSKSLQILVEAQDNQKFLKIEALKEIRDVKMGV